MLPTFRILIYGSILFLLSACKVNHLAEEKVEFYRINESNYAEEDQTIKEIIAPYKTDLDEQMNAIIGQVAASMDKARPESTLGNWFADALYDYCKVAYKDVQLAFAVQNYGGMRIPNVPSGPLSRGKIFELMPFDNNLVFLDLDAATLIQFINKMAGSGGWPVSKQLRYEIKDKKAQNISIDGQAIDETKHYWVALPDYIANGGGNCPFLIDIKRSSTGKLIRDALIEYIIAQNDLGESINGVLDGRVKSVD